MFNLSGGHIGVWSLRGWGNVQVHWRVGAFDSGSRHSILMGCVSVGSLRGSFTKCWL